MPDFIGYSTVEDPLSTSRHLAKLNGWREIYHNPKSLVVSFYSEDTNGATMRLNYYYTTGTVGTSLHHPKRGKTQLFRRNVTQGELNLLFRNPRMHSGKGYYESNDRHIMISANNVVVSDEETMLQQILHELDEQRNEVQLQLQVLKEKREAEEKIRQEKREAEERIRQANIYAAEEARQAKIMAAQLENARIKRNRMINKRGNNYNFYLAHQEYFPTSMKDVKCVSLTEGSGYIAVFDTGSCCYSNISEALATHIEEQHNSNIDYIAVGPDDCYFVQKFNGKSAWNIEGFDGDILKSASSGVKFFAIGPNSGYYVENRLFYIKFKDGSSQWGGDINESACECFRSDRAIQHVWLGENDNYFICYKDGGYTYELSSDMESKVFELLKGHNPKQVLINGWNESTFFVRYS